MKKIILFLALAVGALSLSAQTPTPTEAVASQPASHIQAALPDSVLSARLYVIDTTIAGISARVDANYEHQHEHDRELRQMIGSSDRDEQFFRIANIVQSVAILTVIMVSVVLIVFFICQYSYRTRKQKFEFEQARLDRVDYNNPDVVEKIVTVYSEPTDGMPKFYRRLMYLALVCCGIALFISMCYFANGRYSGGFIGGFLPGFLFFALAGACGGAAVYMFREYVSRTDADRK